MRGICIIVLMWLFSFTQTHSQNPKREMRAIWIATVNNIDWPSKPDLPVEEQKEEFKELLDLAVGYNLNTVIFQIRPAADAFYKSGIEPWSQWLNGKQGIEPAPFYDPLDFAIAECRKRGLDIHAWLNPYRAVTDTAHITDSMHVTSLHPEWFLLYGKTLYFDPGLQEVRDWVSAVAGDIVRRYDIDAIHMDDYFYPYRIANQSFPDDSSFLKYPRGYLPDQRDDWRRNNVDLIIKQLSDTIKSIKSWVEFGISPFGVWRNFEKDPSGSLTKAGQTNYDDLFADILLWQREGWIDYITPQIYWHIGKEVADYAVLTEWWSRNTFGCRLYIGQAPYRIDKKAVEKDWRSSKEIIAQIEMNRSYPNISGSMFFSAKHLRRDPLNLKRKLTKNLYNSQALPPSNNRIMPIVPEQPVNPQIMVAEEKIMLTWEKGENTKNFVLYRFKKNKAATIENGENIVLVTSETSVLLPVNRRTDTKRYFYMLTSQSSTNTESDPVYFYPPPGSKLPYTLSPAPSASYY